MANTSLRGTRLGATSYENDAHVVMVDRVFVAYSCPKGHETTIPYSAEAEEIPYEWECRCGANAHRTDVEAPEAKEAKVGRSHWDMLLERRTINDLEDLLSERLDLLAAKRTPQRARKTA